MEDDEEGDIEETVLLVDLNGIPNPSLVQQLNSTKCYVLGIESEAPVIQVGNYVFKGQYKDIPGTALLFENESTPEGRKQNDKFTLTTKSHKRLVAERTTLKQKLQQQDNEGKYPYMNEEPPLPGEGESPTVEEPLVPEKEFATNEESPLPREGGSPTVEEPPQPDERGSPMEIEEISKSTDVHKDVT